MRKGKVVPALATKAYRGSSVYSSTHS